MKKLINDLENVVNESVEGFVLANQNQIKKVGNLNVVARKDAPVEKQVGIVIGGGSGHEPLFLEYVGKGMADVAVCGEVFVAPSPKPIYEAIKVADGGKGVILLYNNYSGDVLNFNMAQEMAREDNIKIDTVLINDEIASAPKEKMEERRGTTADHIIIKIAGAATQAGLDFEKTISLLKKSIYNARSLGVSLSACSLPGADVATFSVEEGKMEFGLGLHGEPGIKTLDIMSADDTTKLMIETIIEDLPFRTNDEVIVIVNGYGCTTRLELNIVMRAAHMYLREKGINIYASELGEFCTSLDMAGIAITLIKLDQEMKKYYDMPAYSPAYKKF